MSKPFSDPMSEEDLVEAERQALVAAVEEALADPRPDIPHEEVRAEMLRDLAEARAGMEKTRAA